MGTVNKYLLSSRRWPWNDRCEGSGDKAGRLRLVAGHSAFLFGRRLRSPPELEFKVLLASRVVLHQKSKRIRVLLEFHFVGRKILKSTQTIELHGIFFGLFLRSDVAKIHYDPRSAVTTFTKRT